MSAGSTSAWWVTSRPDIRIGIPDSKTIAAASGSAQMLNSAAAVVLPAPSEPPISEIAATRSWRAGAERRSRAMLVSGPVATSVTGLGGVAQQRAHQFDSRHVDRSDGGLRQVRAVEPGFTVELDRDPRVADQRAVGAGGDGHVGSPEQGQDAERVAGRPIERSVARDGRDRQEPELRPGQREHDRERVVMARVAVEDDRDAGHLPKPIAAVRRGAKGDQRGRRERSTSPLAARRPRSLRCAPAVGPEGRPYPADAIPGQLTAADVSVLDLEEDTCASAALDWPCSPGCPSSSPPVVAAARVRHRRRRPPATTAPSADASAPASAPASEAADSRT